MKKLTLLTINLLIVAFAFAQKNISGTVNDATGNPLPGVNVVEKGTFNGKSTDAVGKFSLIVKENATLVFSFVGFITQEVALGDT